MTRAVAVLAALASAVFVFVAGAHLGAIGTIAARRAQARRSTQLAATHTALDLYDDEGE